MARPAVFFDRDNTLIVADGYLGEAAKVVLIDGAADAVARAHRLGFAVVTFSNQSGVARGMFAEEAVHAVNARLDELLFEQNPAAIIDRHEFCPFHPEGSIEFYRQESPRRKPAPGMILAAAEALSLDLAKSWVIGDAPRDIEAGKAAGCRTILFQDPALAASPAAGATPRVLPDHSVQSLSAAMEIIERDSSGERSTLNAQRPVVSLSNHSTSNEKTAVGTSSVQGSTVASSTDLHRLESLAEQILQQLRPASTSVTPEAHFSLSKMIAGIVQVLALAALVLAYRTENPQNTLLLAIMLQLFTIALLIMGRQT
jgi:D-glycero-D-manno-heptose 1,7-bisphosphate phosphatase